MITRRRFLQGGLVALSSGIVVPAWADTETLAPDQIYTSVNLDGGASVVTDIDEGVGTPGGDWLITDDDGSDTIIQVSFPDATGALNTGAGLQTFRLYVRKAAVTGGNNPTLTVTVREGASATDLATPINAVTVSSESGVIVSGTWDASVLSTQAASTDVRLHAVGSRSGGSPATRRTVEFDAVEWIVDYAAPASSRRRAFTNV